MSYDPRQLQYAAEIASCQVELMIEAIERACVAADAHNEALRQVMPLYLDLERRCRLEDFVDKRERRLSSRYWKRYLARGRRARGHP